MILNTVIALRPRRPIRIVASDYWRNISPTMRQLSETGLILIDRKEAFSAGLENTWRHNARFLHINHFLSLRGKQRGAYSHERLHQEWMNVRRACSLRPLSLTLAQTSTLMERL